MDQHRSRGRQLAIRPKPDSIPPGPLDDYVTWLWKLHSDAGAPSVRTMATELSRHGPHVDPSTLQRHMKKAPANTALVYQLVQYLVERRPAGAGTEADVDRAHNRLAELLLSLAGGDTRAGADEVARAPAQSARAGNPLAEPPPSRRLAPGRLAPCRFPPCQFLRRRQPCRRSRSDAGRAAHRGPPIPAGHALAEPPRCPPTLCPGPRRSCC